VHAGLAAGDKCVCIVEAAGQPALLLELLRTHPKLLIAGLVIDNPHSLGPDEYVATRRARAWAGLTEGEHGVAELVGQGLSTAEVAARQSRSRPDVDRMLHTVLRKLGVTTRDELVRFLAERRDTQ
jgi:DNA-binding CsgD family transcriptional regulator